MNFFRNFILCFIVHWSEISVINCDCDDKVTREKRGAKFPTNAALGIIVAIAVPLDLPKRNVFMSYNFEANYNNPTAVTDIVPGPLLRLELNNARNNLKDNGDDDLEYVTDGNFTMSDVYNGEDDETTENPIVTTAKEEWKSKNIEKREIQPIKSLLSRDKMYKILVNKFKSEGYDGMNCLLRAICETAETAPMNHNNGALGDIFHILLTPSSSRLENIDPQFYRAEQMGHQQNCHEYQQLCRRNILDLITKVSE